MPPKKTQRKVVSVDKDLCCICCQKISAKDEALFCSGSCQKYLHRYCASVGEQSFKLYADSAQPFLCFCCFRSQKDEQLASLLSVIESLKEEINSLKSQKIAHISESESEVANVHPAPSPNSTRRPAAVSSKSPIDTLQNHMSQNQEKKFNVVLYGVPECPTGLSKFARFESDQSNIVSILSSLVSSFESLSIKDCHRLGKFKKDAQRPRPLLIKFIRVADVVNIMSKRRYTYPIPMP